jgi:hypothetical protein
MELIIVYSPDIILKGICPHLSKSFSRRLSKKVKIEYDEDDDFGEKGDFQLVCETKNAGTIIKYIRDNEQSDGPVLAHERAIYYACGAGNLQAVIGLVKMVGDSKILNIRLCLDNACANGHFTVVKYLRGVIGKEAFSKRTFTIEKACKSGNLDLVNFIINEQGGDTDWIMGLLGACEGGHVEIVQKILTLYSVPFWSQYALDAACRNGHLLIVELLLREGVRVFRNFDEDETTYGNIDILHHFRQLKGSRSREDWERISR